VSNSAQGDGHSLNDPTPDGPARHRHRSASSPPPGWAESARTYVRGLLGRTLGQMSAGAAGAVGTALVLVVFRHFLVALILMAVIALATLGLFLLGPLLRALGALWRRLGPAQPRAADRQAAELEDTAHRHEHAWRVRGGILAIELIPAACGFALGYWVLGFGFARGVLTAALAVLVTLIVIAASLAALRWPRHSWPSWLRNRSLTTLACCLAVLSMGVGVKLGQTDLAPPCPTPTELRVLTSQEDLGAIQAVIPAFEQYEPAHRHTGCYVVNLTAYAGPSDSAAWSGFSTGWGPSALSSAGPRPDIWIPTSSAEVSEVASHLPTGLRIKELGSVGSSPLVVGVPDGLLREHPSLVPLEHNKPWATLYGLLGQAKIGLAMPNPELSETSRLAIAELYPALSSQQQRKIEKSGSFPPDSQNLLCGAAQAAEQGKAQPATSYLVSEASVISNNANQLTEGACTTLAGSPPGLTALYPAGAAALDFPFTVLHWAGSSAGPAREQYAADFYHWLTSRAARGTLQSWGLRVPGCGTLRHPAPGVAAHVPSCGQASLPRSARISRALASFQQAQAPAHILVGIDDSGPMQPYLPQITAAIDAELGPGPGGTHLGRHDSFGIWELPGRRRGQTDEQLVGFGPAATVRPQVAAHVGVLNGHDHSANYDMLTNAAGSLYAPPPASPEPINSVVLLTDGDGYPQGDPDGHYGLGVINTFDHPPAGHSAIKLFIIAFGPAGCAQSGAGPANPSMAALADATGGYCLQANGSDPHQLLAQVLGQISAGG